MSSLLHCWSNQHTKMKFQSDALTEKELEIAAYLLRGFSAERIAEETESRTRLIDAHIRNMREKLNAADHHILLQVLKAHSGEENSNTEQTEL